MVRVLGAFSLACLQVHFGLAATSSAPALVFIERISDPDLNYAAESRNYPEDPSTLFVTCRGGGFKVFDMESTPGKLEAIGRWNSSLAVEGQDRLGNWLVVSELGIGPSGPFPGSSPKLHFFNVSLGLDVFAPLASVDLSLFIDAILHVKFIVRGAETWCVCSGGFATSVSGAVVLVNVTHLLSKPQHWDPQDANGKVSVLSTSVSQPEGVTVAPLDANIVYVGGISSKQLAVVNVADFFNPFVEQVRDKVGAQLVSASWKDQPHENEASSSSSFDPGLVFMSAWGRPGGLVIMDTAEGRSVDPVEVGRLTKASLSMSNRVKLAPWGGVAFLPLEEEVGGVAAVSFAVPSASFSHEVNDANFSSMVAHVPVSEFTKSGSLVTSTKAYCLAVSARRFVFLFIAETAAIYVYAVQEEGV